jgi:hypothetical protein
MSITGTDAKDPKMEKTALEAQIRKMKTREGQRQSAKSTQELMPYALGGAVLAVFAGLVVLSGKSAQEIALIVGKRLWYVL